MHRVIQWLKCVSIVIGLCMLKWKMTEAAPSCPNGFDCSGVENCYLIYPENGEWKYQDPEGETHDTGAKVSLLNHCYKFITVSTNRKSCIDAQRECEVIGGNITVVNSKAEYDQLTNNVEHVLSVGTKSKFNAHHDNGLRQKKCILINVANGYIWNNAKKENIDCSHAVEINTIICESTDASPDICPVPSQSTTLVPELTKTSLVTSTSADYAISSTNNISPPHASEQHKSSANLVAAICVPLVVIILIVLIAFFLIRRKRKKRQMVDRDSKVDGNSIKQDKLQTGSYKHGAAIPSIDQSELYHDTVVKNEVYGLIS
ncbi:uncharacterized protein [Antedon mediterranea]|uniref:uncharacterized protein n=1 Tax=Antedon mediterranea TaxID=105859 RepID=UPI003AF646C5